MNVLVTKLKLWLVYDHRLNVYGVTLRVSAITTQVNNMAAKTRKGLALIITNSQNM